MALTSATLAPLGVCVGTHEELASHKHAPVAKFFMKKGICKAHTQQNLADNVHKLPGVNPKREKRT